MSPSVDEASARELHANSLSSRVLPPLPDPAVVFQGPGYQAPLPPTNPAARTSLFACVGGVFFPPVVLIALICGVYGLVISRSRRGVGRHDAVAGIVISLVMGTLWGLFMWMLYNLA